jgi:hypothetical protein
MELAGSEEFGGSLRRAPFLDLANTHQLLNRAGGRQE